MKSFRSKSFTALLNCVDEYLYFEKAMFMIHEHNAILHKLRALLNSDLLGLDELRLSEADEYLKVVCSKVAPIIGEALDTEQISIYTTGFRPGFFTKVYQGGGLIEKAQYPTNSTNYHFIHKIQRLGLKKFQSLKDDGACESIDKNSLVFYLFGRGEIFGFIIVRQLLDVDEAKAFFTEFSHEINAILADQIFSHRMSVISTGLLSPTRSDYSLEDFGAQVAELTTRGFGADGGTFRIFSDQSLQVVGSAGHVSKDILSARQSGEELSGLLFDSPKVDWTAVVLSDGDEDWSFGGINVPELVKEKLRSNGLFSVLMCKLHGRNSDGVKENYGTLSYYFLRTTAYSRRDVSLFKSFAERVSTYLSMYYSYTELKQQNDIVEMQGRIMTFSEVANLLAHDIWHKSNALAHDSEELERLFRRNADRGRISENEHGIIAKERILDQIDSRTEKLVFSANELQDTTGKYKKLQQADDEQIYRKSEFKLADAIDNVEQTLRSALDRRRVSIKRRNLSGRLINGPRFLFEQVLYNLCINSIDAISANGAKSKGGEIEITSHVDAGGHIIRFSDSGPGIDYKSFPDEKSVFDIGKTTKKKGSGTGLNIARQLIGSHFGGELQVTSRRPATFTIVIPI